MSEPYSKQQYKAVMVQPGEEMTAAWLEYLMREREAQIIRLGHIEDVLIRHGRLSYRSIIPHRKRY